MNIATETEKSVKLAQFQQVKVQQPTQAIEAQQAYINELYGFVFYALGSALLIWAYAHYELHKKGE